MIIEINAFIASDKTIEFSQMEHKLIELIEFSEYYKINSAWTWVNLKIISVTYALLAVW